MSLAKKIRRQLEREEKDKGFTDFVKERPLDTYVRKLHRRMSNAKRTRSQKKQ